MVDDDDIIWTKRASPDTISVGDEYQEELNGFIVTKYVSSFLGGRPFAIIKNPMAYIRHLGLDKPSYRPWKGAKFHEKCASSRNDAPPLDELLRTRRAI